MYTYRVSFVFLFGRAGGGGGGSSMAYTIVREKVGLPNEIVTFNSSIQFVHNTPSYHLHVGI